MKNVPYTQQQYKEILSRYARKNPDETLAEFLEFHRTVPKRAQIQLNCEGSTGDYLVNCHNAIDCSVCINIEDSKYLVECEGVKDSMDLSMHDKDVVLCYELCTGGEKSYLTRFSVGAIAAPNTLYTYSCFYLEDSFGCDGFHARRRNCILNKQYTKDEYEDLVPKIIAKMRSEGKWGEFFPIELSPFAYNETLAQEYLPLTKEEVTARGWQWRDQNDEMPKVAKVIPASKLPASIADIPDDIVNWAIECEVTKKPFKIIKQELEFYRKMQLPIPRLHPDERHRRRMALRNPRKLWSRECAKCHQPMTTSYPPERPEIVYCERCYLETVY